MPVQGSSRLGKEAVALLDLVPLDLETAIADIEILERPEPAPVVSIRMRMETHLASSPRELIGHLLGRIDPPAFAALVPRG
jgi:hypothetical protein